MIFIGVCSTAFLKKKLSARQKGGRANSTNDSNNALIHVRDQDFTTMLQSMGRLLNGGSKNDEATQLWVRRHVGDAVDRFRQVIIPLIETKRQVKKAEVIEVVKTSINEDIPV
jgi:protoporphyrinogen oxidase